MKLENKNPSSNGTEERIFFPCNLRESSSQTSNYVHCTRSHTICFVVVVFHFVLLVAVFCLSVQWVGASESWLVGNPREDLPASHTPPHTNPFPGIWGRATTQETATDPQTSTAHINANELVQISAGFCPGDCPIALINFELTVDHTIQT